MCLYTHTHTQSTQALPLWTLQRKLLSWYDILTLGLSSLLYLLFGLTGTSEPDLQPGKVTLYLRRKGPKTSYFWIIYMAYGCRCGKTNQQQRSDFIKHTFHNCILNNASHKAEIRACFSMLKCSVICLQRKLKLQAKRPGALCKLKRRNPSQEIWEQFKVRLQWALNLDFLTLKSSTLLGNREKPSGRTIFSFFPYNFLLQRTHLEGN